MLQDSYQSVLEVRNRDEFQVAIVKFAQNLGFNTVSAIAVFDHLLGHSDFIPVNNTPAAYVKQCETFENGRRDPVMQHCKASGRPIIWDQSTYLQSGHGDMWEQQASFGYCTGIAMALHMPEGRHFQFGVDRDQALPRDPQALSRLVADLQLFAVYAQEGAARVLLPPPAEPEEGPKLTPRELEALRWTLEGKTAWEVGRILSISERTAVFHVNNAMHKLNCVTKHQAALKAQRLGLLR